MLILLIAVTPIFLLIMGAVTTSVLSRKLGGQFNADLIAASARDPRGLEDNTGGYLAVAVSVRTGQAVLLTPGTQASQLASALGPMTLPDYRQRFRAEPATITLPGGQNVRGVGRGITATKLGAAGIAVPSGGAYVLVVAHSTDTVAGQVGGVVIAELITGGGELWLCLVRGGQFYRS